MTVENTPAPPGSPWAKKRILETATRLFYAEGIRLVGVDRLIGESHVTKATFYKHYRSKDNLVIAYVSGAHSREREEIENLIRESSGPKEAINAIIAIIVTQLHSPEFRGSLFVNAAVEHPDPTHPVRMVVAEHRDWYSTTIETLLAQSGHPLPGDGADDFVIARDGAMCGGYAGDPVAAVGALRRAVDHILTDVRT
ncbi:MAG: TetR/AcrR family transcriptional regulator [Microbacteriaceae bacterium]|nr:TetR/AcrR family transcriptional regulator [Microbacteriaceae bacterium]